MAQSLSISRAHLVSRILAALLGGYAFTWGTVALGVAGFFAAGLEFHDAEHLSYLIGFLVFLTAFLLAFSARSLPRVWLVLLGGGALMTAAASLLQGRLV
jgi:glucan phosphoethanolaminetransferase (alkaline phosphatase superfamily)